MEKNEPCDSANVREQNMGSGRAGVSSGVTEPPAGSLSYSRLFVRLGKATLVMTARSWGAGGGDGQAQQEVHQRVVEGMSAMVSYQRIACSSS